MLGLDNWFTDGGMWKHHFTLGPLSTFQKQISASIFRVLLEWRFRQQVSPKDDCNLIFHHHENHKSNAKAMQVCFVAK
jgi:hypothetical protein